MYLAQYPKYYYKKENQNNTDRNFYHKQSLEPSFSFENLTALYQYCFRTDALSYPNSFRRIPSKTHLRNSSFLRFTYSVSYKADK